MPTLVSFSKLKLKKCQNKMALRGWGSKEFRGEALILDLWENPPIVEITDSGCCKCLEV